MKAKKKVSPKPTNIAFILDETGSMISCKDKAISGFNEYIDTLKRSKRKFKLTLTKFNSNYIKKEYIDKSIEDVPKLSDENYHPDHLTPLYDAIGKTINEVQDKTNMLVIILTDGEENSSREYNKDSIAKLIKEKEDIGWEFVFLGADYKSFDDAWKTASTAGFSHSGSVCCFATTDFSLTMGNLANNTISYSMGNSEKGKFFKKTK